MSGPDIVERLRKPTDGDALYDHVFVQRQQTRSDLPRMNLNNTLELIDEERAEAAATITALRAEVAALREALAEISDLHGEINPSNYDHDDACELNRQFCYAITSARAALERTKP